MIEPVSIIIPAFNKVEITKRCLEVLEERTPKDLYRLCLVNNGCRDGTKELFEEVRQRTGAIVITNFTNNGCTLAYHAGSLASVEHEFILFLNNDTEVQPGWLEALLETMNTPPGSDGRLVGIVGPKLIYPDDARGQGRLQEAGSVVFQDGSTYGFGWGDQPQKEIFNQTCEVDYVSCALIRNSVFKDFGGIDTEYSPAYYEDVDICFSMRKSGYKVVYEPRSNVKHIRGATIGNQMTLSSAKNQAKFCAKWKDELMWQGTPLALGGNPLSTADRAIRLSRVVEDSRNLMP